MGMTPSRPYRVFLLSPAHCGGIRAGYLLKDTAEFDLARRLRSPGGAPLGEVFAFLSGLYFRGKLAYARAFARPPEGVLVITTTRGLVHPDARVTASELRDMSRGDIHAANESYRRPLEDSV